MPLMVNKDPPFWLVRTQTSTNSTLSLGITPLTGTQSLFLTLQLVLSCGCKRVSMQMLSILCTAHFSLSKFQFLSPQISGTTLPCSGLCCGSEIASRHKPGTTLLLIPFVSLLRRVLELYCPCVISKKSYFIDFVQFSSCLQQESKFSPSCSLTSEIEVMPREDPVLPLLLPTSPLTLSLLYSISKT